MVIHFCAVPNIGHKTFTEDHGSYGSTTATFILVLS